MNIPSYSSIFNLGHKALTDLFSDDVLVEEKVDGSQFAMMRVRNETFCRSHSQQINVDYPDKMFAKAVEVAKTLPLHDGWIYRGEYLSKPKHNSLAYNRTPKNNIIIFDIDTADQNYLSYEDKTIEADRIGLEIVPILYKGKLDRAESVLKFLEQESILGGQKIEGMVFKNYNRFSPDKKTLMGKYVSEVFKEVHEKTWGERNPSGKDFIQLLVEQYRTPARWQKAVQHQRELGILTDSPKDIGVLLKAVHADIEKECGEEIKEKIYGHFKTHLMRGVICGFPEWYKEELLKRQFE
jgi:ATP-dependent RNA circularization protein (DNA/RNA ligase family)